MKKRNLKSLKINKQLISSINDSAIVGGATRGCYLTTGCPTDSMVPGCYTLNPLNCIAPPTP